MSGSGTSSTFDGAGNNSAGYYKVVKRVQTVRVGDYVCTSGGNSGVHCNIKITALNVSYTDSRGRTFKTTQGYQTTAGGIAAVTGDSGGPVFFFDSNMTTVGAVGIIQGGSSELTSCGSVHDAVPTCGRWVAFSPIGTLLSDIGASLFVG